MQGVPSSSHKIVCPGGVAENAEKRDDEISARTFPDINVDKGSFFHILINKGWWWFWFTILHNEYWILYPNCVVESPTAEIAVKEDQSTNVIQTAIEGNILHWEGLVAYQCFCIRCESIIVWFCYESLIITQT